ncbi:hypothetical protein SAMN05660976_02623 [Nonomuraea pusilla]|uniref:Uncharacterized protein n=1 Tax=Nonomuraea pusilla TaxID=46177 RepID=A0A1H7QPJ1_9ACTN|nr:hypothetical protein SAMN05660976_02623 [Nonomuraea pusilla]
MTRRGPGWMATAQAGLLVDHLSDDVMVGGAIGADPVHDRQGSYVRILPFLREEAAWHPFLRHLDATLTRIYGTFTASKGR